MAKGKGSSTGIALTIPGAIMLLIGLGLLLGLYLGITKKIKDAESKNLIQKNKNVKKKECI